MTTTSSKTVTREQCDPETTRFVWQGWRLLQEQFAPHAGYGDRCRTWCYDPDSPWTPLAALGHTGGYPSVQIQYLHCDLNSAPLECTDEQGQLRWSGDYAPFGEVTNPVINSMQMLKNQVHIPLRYAGQYEDRETGLHYNLFRYYDPQVGRFTTPDPIGVLGGLNLYRYAPNPNGWVDPLGLVPWEKGAFNSWFNEASVQDIIDNKTAVESALRSPGGMHEMFPVSIASKAKELGFSAEELKAMTVPTSEITFINVTDRNGSPVPNGPHHGSKAGRHFHNKLIGDLKNADTKMQAIDIIETHHSTHMKRTGCLR